MLGTGLMGVEMVEGVVQRMDGVVVTAVMAVRVVMMLGVVVLAVALVMVVQVKAGVKYEGDKDGGAGIT